MTSAFETLTDQIRRAILNRCLLRFKYEGLTRVVEPHIFGRDTKGDDLLTAWQTSGQARSKPSTGWRTFRVDQLRDVEVLSELFAETRPGYNPNDPRIVQIHIRLPPSTLRLMRD